MDALTLGDAQGHELQDRPAVRPVDGDLGVEGARQAHEGGGGSRVQADGVRDDRVPLRPRRRGRGPSPYPAELRGSGAGRLLGGHVVHAGGQGCCDVGDLVEVFAELGPHGGCDGPFDEAGVDETHALGLVAHVDDGFDGHRGRAEVGQDDDAAAVPVHGRKGCLEGCLHAVVGRANAAVVGASGSLEVNVGGHLGGELAHAGGQGGRVRDDHIRDAHAHAAPTSPAARAAARRMREVETAPGSRCPMERSPR